ncbi:hypothetical protein EJB05_15083, partial [Eragrostis curvula]
MGNAGGRHRIVDVEEDALAALAEAAAMGARTAVREAHGAAAAEAGAQGDGPGLPVAPANGPMVAGVLRLRDAETAAAEGAARAMTALARLMAPAGHQLASDHSMRQVMASAAGGAAAGVRAAAIQAAMAAHPPAPDEEVVLPPGLAIDLNAVAAAGAYGAWIALVSLVGGPRRTGNTNRWSSLLAPILGACVGASATLFAHLAASPSWSIVAVLGGLGVIMLTLMIGIAAVPFTRSITPESISRHAGFVAFLMITLLHTLSLCYLTWDKKDQRFMATAASFGSAAGFALLVLWYFSGRI